MAHGGTLFLDELGELPLAMQSKLLRFTESGEFYPVGSTQSEKVDVRIITATNRNLMQMVKDGTFRSDLYYRLHVIPIRIPALRERPEDIEAIAAYYIDRYNKKYCKKTMPLEDSLSLLLQYNWPGNVRELRNVIERAVLMSQAGSQSFPYGRCSIPTGKTEKCRSRTSLDKPGRISNAVSLQTAALLPHRCSRSRPAACRCHEDL